MVRRNGLGDVSSSQPTKRVTRSSTAAASSASLSSNLMNNSPSVALQSSSNLISSSSSTTECSSTSGTLPIPERPQPSSSPAKCAICLGELTNRCYTNSCIHQFCFGCLLEWSKIKAECPLCKSNFQSIYHNIRENDDYDEYRIPPPLGFPSLGSSLRFPFRIHTPTHHINIRHVLGPSAFVHDHGYSFQRLVRERERNDRNNSYIRIFEVGPVSEPHALDYMRYSSVPPPPNASSTNPTTVPIVSSPQSSQPSFSLPSRNPFDTGEPELFGSYEDNARAVVTDTALRGYQTRKRIYDRSLFVKPVGRYLLVPSVTYVHNNPSSETRISRWLYREISVLMGIHRQRTSLGYVYDLIMSLISRYDVLSRDFRQMLATYFGDRTTHFQHELYHFIVSGLTMEQYDNVSVYNSHNTADTSSSSSNTGIRGGPSKETTSTVTSEPVSSSSTISSSASENRPIRINAEIKSTSTSASIPTMVSATTAKIPTSNTPAPLVVTISDSSSDDTLSDDSSEEEINSPTSTDYTNSFSLRARNEIPLKLPNVQMPMPLNIFGNTQKAVGSVALSTSNPNHTNLPQLEDARSSAFPSLVPVQSSFPSSSVLDTEKLSHFNWTRTNPPLAHTNQSNTNNQLPSSTPNGYFRSFFPLDEWERPYQSLNRSIPTPIQAHQGFPNNDTMIQAPYSRQRLQGGIDLFPTGNSSCSSSMSNETVRHETNRSSCELERPRCPVESGILSSFSSSASASITQTSTAPESNSTVGSLANTSIPNSAASVSSPTLGIIPQQPKQEQNEEADEEEDDEIQLLGVHPIVKPPPLAIITLSSDEETNDDTEKKPKVEGISKSEEDSFSSSELIPSGSYCNLLERNTNPVVDVDSSSSLSDIEIVYESERNRTVEPLTLVRKKKNHSNNGPGYFKCKKTRYDNPVQLISSTSSSEEDSSSFSSNLEVDVVSLDSSEPTPSTSAAAKKRDENRKNRKNDGHHNHLSSPKCKCKRNKKKLTKHHKVEKSVSLLFSSSDDSSSDEELYQQVLEKRVERIAKKKIKGVSNSVGERRKSGREGRSYGLSALRSIIETKRKVKQSSRKIKITKIPTNDQLDSVIDETRNSSSSLSFSTSSLSDLEILATSSAKYKTKRRKVSSSFQGIESPINVDETSSSSSSSSSSNTMINPANDLINNHSVSLYNNQDNTENRNGLEPLRSDNYGIGGETVFNYLLPEDHSSQPIDLHVSPESIGLEQFDINVDVDINEGRDNNGLDLTIHSPPFDFSNAFLGIDDSIRVHSNSDRPSSDDDTHPSYWQNYY